MIIIKQKSGKFAKNPCNYCGDGVWADSENCGEGRNSNYYGTSPTESTGTEKVRCATAFTVSNNDKYYINIPGVYCFTVKGGNGGYGYNQPGCSGATVKGCYKLQRGDLVTFRIGNAGSRPTFASEGNSCSSFNGGGGGGGASWVFLSRGSTDTLLLVAGGGGGGGGGTGNYDTACGGGSSTTSVTNYTDGTPYDDACTDYAPEAGSVVDANNFADSGTTGVGGRGGYYYSRSGCNNKNCDQKQACGGGGGGYSAGGAAGPYFEVGGGGGGSYVNEDSAYFDSGKTMDAGSEGITSSASAGSIKVEKPKSNATCSTTNCQWSSSYSACN